MLQIWMEILYFGRLQEVLGLRAQKDQQVMLLKQRLKKLRETAYPEIYCGYISNSKVLVTVKKRLYVVYKLLGYKLKKLKI